MSFARLIVLLSLTLLGITAGAAPTGSGRVLACNIGALTPEQRTRHAAMTERLLKAAKRTDLKDGYLFTIDRERISVPELAEWVADEARCCPAVDFHLELPVNGPLTLRLDGGEDVKKFIAAELGL
ncbi:MAG: hypothetical protein M3P06_00825 [Acidobacteriota bacterium]|nr:hypothetical protein [Acidobacteriota bacterium]